MSLLLFSCQVVSDFLCPPWTVACQAMLSSPSPRVFPSLCPLNQWCHPPISSSVVPFSSCIKSFPASGSFPINQLFTTSGQSIEGSASASVLPMNIQDLLRLGLTGLIFLLSKELSKVFSSTPIWKHQFFGALSFLWSSSQTYTWLLERPWPWLCGPWLAVVSLIFNTLSRFIIQNIARNKWQWIHD